MGENMVMDVVSTGEAVAPVIAQGMPLDILNRQEFVDRVFNLVEVIASQRGSCTFALDGVWGSGKTFVLNMLEPKLREWQDGNKYLVFHYNCWQYDYYEEPLVAIVSVILDTLRSCNLSKASAIFRTAVETASGIFDGVLQSLQYPEIFKIIKDGTDKAENTTHSFDPYFDFKEAMSKAQSALKTLTDRKTLVVVVDELDRCLPEYTIKVLERLHHLFFELDNSVVILAVDKEQLDNTVKQIFGPDTVTEAYLKKFINFHLSLDVGRVTSSFREKYQDYVAMFDESLTELSFDIDEFISALFAGIEIRGQERIMEQIRIAHTVLFDDSKRDYMFMCFELMWAVLSKHYGFYDKSPFRYNEGEFEGEGSFCFDNHHDAILSGSHPYPEIHKELADYYRAASTANQCVWLSEYSSDYTSTTYHLTFSADCFHLLIWYYLKMFESDNTQFALPENLERCTLHLENIDAFRSFTQFLGLLG